MYFIFPNIVLYIFLRYNCIRVLSKGGIKTDFSIRLAMHYNKYYTIDDKLAIVLVNDKWGVINYKLDIIIPFEYEMITAPSSDVFFAYKDFTYGAFNTKGEIILPFKYKTYHMIFNTYYKKILKKEG